MKKFIFAAMFVALGVTLSTFYIPVGASKVFPFQHMFNVMLAIIVGTRLNVLSAFSTSLLRNLLGLGSILAYPGSMIGAFLAGIVYKKTNNILFTALAEVFGTGILGGLVSYPIAGLVLGKEVAVFAFVIPFVSSSFVGALMGYIIITTMKKKGLLKMIENKIAN